MTVADETRRQELHALLGDLPEASGPIGVERTSVDERAGYILETLVLDPNGIESVPLCFIRPKAQAGSLPVIL